jgi:hypothetical protein
VVFSLETFCSQLIYCFGSSLVEFAVHIYLRLGMSTFGMSSFHVGFPTGSGFSECMVMAGSGIAYGVVVR